MICPEARNNTRMHLERLQVGSGLEQECPSAELGSLDPNELKDLRFATLTPIISEVNTRASIRISEIDLSNTVTDWDTIVRNVFMLGAKCIDEFFEDTAYTENPSHHRHIVELMPGEPSMLQQLKNGFGTSTTTSFGVLSGIPNILNAHGLDPSRSEEAARNSFGLAWSLSMRSVISLTEAKTEIADGYSAPGLFVVKNYDLFKVVDESNLRVMFDDPKNLGTNEYDTVPTVGCPATLAKNSFEALWQSYIDVAVRNDAWDFQIKQLERQNSSAII